MFKNNTAKTGVVFRKNELIKRQRNGQDSQWKNSTCKLKIAIIAEIRWQEAENYGDWIFFAEIVLSYAFFRNFRNIRLFSINIFEGFL